MNAIKSIAGQWIKEYRHNFANKYDSKELNFCVQVIQDCMFNLHALSVNVEFGLPTALDHVAYTDVEIYKKLLCSQTLYNNFSKKYDIENIPRYTSEIPETQHKFDMVWEKNMKLFDNIDYYELASWLSDCNVYSQIENCLRYYKSEDLKRDMKSTVIDDIKDIVKKITNEDGNYNSNFVKEFFEKYGNTPMEAVNGFIEECASPFKDNYLEKICELNNIQFDKANEVILKIIEIVVCTKSPLWTLIVAIRYSMDSILFRYKYLPEFHRVIEGKEDNDEIEMGSTEDAVEELKDLFKYYDLL